MVVALVQAEVEHNAGAGGLVAALVLEFTGGLVAGGSAEQFAMGADGVLVGDNGVEAETLAFGGRQAGDVAVG